MQRSVTVLGRRYWRVFMQGYPTHEAAATRASRTRDQPGLQEFRISRGF